LISAFKSIFLIIFFYRNEIKKIFDFSFFVGYFFRLFFFFGLPQKNDLGKIREKKVAHFKKINKKVFIVS
jgi:hypothetical protein